MKKVMIALFLLVILAVPVMAESSLVGVSAKKVGFFDRLFNNPFAVVTEKTIYNPGDIVNVEIWTDVHCNMKSAVLTLTSPSSQVESYDVITSLLDPCSSMIVTSQYKAPSEAGEYIIRITYEDGLGNMLFQEKGYFSVRGDDPVSCPQSYCNDWQVVDRLEHGTIQSQSCYIYPSTEPCQASVDQELRTVCDSGFKAEGSRCVSEDANVAVCGDNEVQVGEQCDLGQGNGVCPSTCDLTCQTSQCAQLPPVVQPTTPSGEGSSSGGLAIGGVTLGLGALAALLIGLAIYFWVKK